MKNASESQSPAAQNSPDEPNTVELIGRLELAHRLEVDVRTVSRMVKRGELPRPCIGQGGRPRWLWCYVIECLKRQHERQCKLDGRSRKKLHQTP